MGDEGHLDFDGKDPWAQSTSKRAWIRNRRIGFVFQFYHLLPELTVLQNVLLPAMVDSSTLGWLARRGPARRAAEEMLDRFDLAGRLRHKPSELSGGERQRVAIARALVNRPKLLLADEPTGNLDSRTGGRILKSLVELNEQTHQTLVMVTHDASLAEMAGRVLHLRDGRLEGA
jgi:lipoprotein-releasing system ATP-binding protein